MKDVTQLRCPAAPAASDNTTHHLVNVRHGQHNVLACVNCHLTPAEIRESAQDAPTRVETWADGYGTWHAKVTLPNGAHTPDFERRARAAIRTEILARENHAKGGLRLTLCELDAPVVTAESTTRHYREA